MVRRLFCVIESVLLGGALAFAIPAPVHSAEPAPSFTLKLLDGGTITSGDLRGKLGVLRFMASW
jgi:hypothetical protein